MTGVNHILQHAVSVEGHLSHEPAGQAEAWEAVYATFRDWHAADLPGPSAAMWAAKSHLHKAKPVQLAMAYWDEPAQIFTCRSSAVQDLPGWVLVAPSEKLEQLGIPPPFHQCGCPNAMSQALCLLHAEQQTGCVVAEDHFTDLRCRRRRATMWTQQSPCRVLFSEVLDHLPNLYLLVAGLPVRAVAHQGEPMTSFSGSSSSATAAGCN